MLTLTGLQALSRTSSQCPATYFRIEVESVGCRLGQAAGEGQ